MTWPICKDMDIGNSRKNVVEIGEVLCKSLVQANVAGRVTSGVMECAKLLRCNPDNVMLCVLPAASGQHDVTLDIQHTLIEAFCWENEIKLVKVDSEKKLAKVMHSVTEDENNNGDVTVTRYQPTDVSCLLVEFPKGQTSAEDRDLIDGLDSFLTADVFPKTIIELPV